MRNIRVIIIVLVVGMCLGIWAGVNMGRDRPWYSNPFAAPKTLGERLRDDGDALLQRTGTLLEDAGRKLRDAAEDE